MVSSWGYNIQDAQELEAIIKKLAVKAFIQGEYTIFKHDKFGVQISIRMSIPGKNEKYGRFYKRESGFTIYPNGKIKNNTLIAKKWEG